MYFFSFQFTSVVNGEVKFFPDFQLFIAEEGPFSRRQRCCKERCEAPKRILGPVWQLFGFLRKSVESIPNGLDEKRFRESLETFFVFMPSKKKHMHVSWFRVILIFAPFLLTTIII